MGNTADTNNNDKTRRAGHGGLDTERRRMTDDLQCNTEYMETQGEGRENTEEHEGERDEVDEGERGNRKERIDITGWGKHYKHNGIKHKEGDKA